MLPDVRGPDVRVQPTMHYLVVYSVAAMHYVGIVQHYGFVNLNGIVYTTIVYRVPGNIFTAPPGARDFPDRVLF